METNQVLLSVTLAVTILFLIIIGTYLLFAIEELRKTMKRINSMIDGFEQVGMNIEHGVSGFLGFFSGMKTFVKTVEKIGAKSGKK